MNQSAAQHKAAILTAAARAVRWDVRVEVQTADGPKTIPVRHPDRIEADGVRERPGGLLFVLWVIGYAIRRVAIGKDTSNRAVERRMRRAVLGAFDPQYRPLIERLGMLDIMQLHEAIGTAQRVEVSRAGEAMRRVMEQGASDLNPSPQPSPAREEGARSGPIVRQNPDGSRTTMFQLVPGELIPGELTGGKRVIHGVPEKAAEGKSPERELRVSPGNPSTEEGCG